MTDEQINIIQAVINALNTIPTMGKDNCAKLFNCMDALASLIEGGPEDDKHVDNG